MFFLNVSKPLAEIPTQLDLVYLILACVGLLILLTCIGSYLFGYGQHLQGRVQEIKAFGADMKISVITVCILVGIGLVVPIVWKSFNDTVGALNRSRQQLESDKRSIEKERDQIRNELESAKSKISRDLILLLELEGIPFSEFPKKADLTVGYYDHNSEFPQIITHDVVNDGKVKRIKVFLKNINNETEYPRLEVVKANTDQKWVFEDFRPGAIPVFVLKKEIVQ
ncbi:hypothetical protein FAM09_15900 [Niastella caeni]|uniref:Uncharacterized protein n=1 Tax=Niastella caeni TaxID=2569763 RepID=A0A4S8HY55_9BACT|nr:hypothetical protein [Niastella caeni]THU38162.1 hypothetical protein FAM09_15900 [Niastella caeni]